MGFFSVLRFLLIVAVGLSAPFRSYAQKPQKLEPSSDWVIDYASDSCRLIRNFGTGDDLFVLTITRYEPGDWFTMSISSNQLVLRNHRKPLELKFGENNAQLEAAFLKAWHGDRPALISRSSLRIVPHSESEKRQLDNWKRGDPSINWDEVAIEGYKSANFLRISRSGFFSFELDTGSLSAPFQAMEKCTDELMTHWGIDVEKHRSLSKKAQPIGDSNKWFTGRYPYLQGRRNQPAIVHYRLNIDAKGNVTDCQIQNWFKADKFDDLVCNNVMKNAKFMPALDAEGNPIASYSVRSVRYTP